MIGGRSGPAAEGLNLPALKHVRNVALGLLDRLHIYVGPHVLIVHVFLDDDP